MKIFNSQDYTMADYCYIYINFFKEADCYEIVGVLPSGTEKIIKRFNTHKEATEYFKVIKKRFSNGAKMFII